MNNSFPAAYFVDGGTLRADTPSYVKRPADDELFEALMDREFCYILTPRQMGKSSLMIRTSQRLKEHNIKTATVDIQGIGTSRVREWYASLLSQIRRGLKLSADIDEWMTKKSNVGFGQLFMDFIQDVVLTEIPEQIVIFLDEVDWMIKIDFRDDFFASLRSMYNARAQYPEFNRISFVLLGVASPADLISEPTRTPFNIGHAIPLQELSLKDATPLQDGLEQVCPGEGKRILERIFYWTNGHPYLTQKICKSIAESGKADWSEAEVDDLVHRLFLAEESRKEANLKFIQDRILSNEQFAQMLKLYSRVRNSKIKESGQSILQNQLMLSGLLTARDGYLEVRNRIYRTVFNDRWINRNVPKNWQRVALVAMSSLAVMLLVVIGYNYTVSLRLKTYQTDYIRGNPPQKITALANIYRLRYLFASNTDIDATAAQAFYDFTPDSKTQLSLFPPYGFSDPAKQNDLVTVIGKLYVTLANVDEENDNTSLLRAMGNALHQGNINNGISNDLERELDNWINGRINYDKGDYISALTDYSTAISINPANQATLYERAKVYIALRQHENALNDLNAAIGAAKQSAPDIPPSPTPTSSPMSPGETPSIRLTETLEPNNTPQISKTLPAGNEKTPTPGETFASNQLTPSPTVTPAVPSRTTPEKFESNFTTLNHVIVAVKSLIDRIPGLQNALQPSSTAYSNLDSVGLVKVYPAPTQKPTADQGVLYQDDFTNPASGWPDETFDNFYVGYHRPENYHIEIDTPNYKVTIFEPERRIFDNATFEVNVGIAEAATAPNGDFRYGVAFRRSGDQFYAFTISPNTKKWFVLKNSPNASVVLVEGSDAGIHDLDSEDTLRVDAQDSNFYFHINNQLVAQITDADYSKGEVGFYVETLDSPMVHVGFNSLIVRNYEAPAINLTQARLLTPGSTIRHQVVDGDWLVQIARCYGADLNAVQNANPRINDVNASLLSGEIVTVPNIGSNGTIYGPPCITYYTAQSGDTWNSIAQKFNADVAMLQASNPGTALVVGIRLLIPLNSAQATSNLTQFEGMVPIPTGTYEVGKDPADDYHIAPKKIPLDGFWIDQYQIINQQYQEYITEWSFPPGEDKHPARGITWEQAAAYCKWKNKRLSTEAEWEAAGRGSGENPPLYPWGRDFIKVGELPGDNTYEVGTLPFNVSPFQVYDMVGNVWEWVGDPYADVPAGYRILRGGRFSIPQDLALRLAIAPDDPRYVMYAGFRCAADQVK